MAQKLGVRGFGIRLLARLIDLIVMLFISVAAGVIILAVFFVLSEKGVMREINVRDLPPTPMPIQVLLGMFAVMAWNGVMEGLCGVSLGKAPFGLRVVTKEGQSCSFGQAILRNLMFPLDAIFFGLVAYASMSKSPLQQRLGDTVAHTVVVSRSKNPEIPKLQVGRFVFALFLGILACAATYVVIGLLRIAIATR